MRTRTIFRLVGIGLFLAVSACSVRAAQPLEVYGAWHCGSDYCTWGAMRSVTEFDQKNHWLIDRGNGTPSVNLVVLSFVHPLKLLKRTTDTTTLDGVPRGMTHWRRTPGSWD
jgi:hypothetical protein